MKKKIHYFQHVPHEGLGYIEKWAQKTGIETGSTHFYKDEPLPKMKDFSMLIIMGGSMNVYEDKKYPWLTDEKKFIEKSIKADKFVLGICLGAQLIADVLGAPVKKNFHKEVGWFPITLTENAQRSKLFSDMPERINVFHWHEDKFCIPRGARKIAQSEACPNQAFEYGEKIVGTQFHFEITKQYVRSWCAESPIKKDKYVLSPKTMLSLTDKYVADSNKCIDTLLNAARCLE